MNARVAEAQVAEAMILEEVNRYQRRLHTGNIGPQIVQLQQSAEQMRLGELRRLASRLQTLTPQQQSAVEALTRGLMNKFLHQPVQAMKAAAGEGNSAAVEVIRDAFAAGQPGEPASDEDRDL